MPKISLDLDNVPYPHRGQQRVMARAKRFNVLACGRRWGKTTFILILIMLAVADNLASGKKQDICFIGINKKNYSPIWNTIKALLKNFITEKSEQDTTLRINDQFNIEFWSMEALSKNEGVRGRAYRLMVIDEMGSLPNFKALWQAVLYSTLDDFEGIAWFCGTPKGFNNFYEFSKYAEHPLMHEDWSFYTATSIENPSFTPKKWAMAKAQLDPEYFAQEYQAQFRALGNNLFNQEDFGWLDFLPNLRWKAQLRYWDIANSEVGSKKGDSTASIRLNAHEGSPLAILDRPRRFKGKWGQTYPQMKAVIMSEPETTHLIETEGIGSMAWEYIQEDMEVDLAGYTIYPAGRQFTSKSKWDRANGWAMKARLKHFHIVRDNTDEDEEVIDEISMFPFHAHDEYIDSISGSHLGMIYLYKGFGTGRNPFDINSPNDVIEPEVFLESVDVDALTRGLEKYAAIISRYSDN